MNNNDNHNINENENDNDDEKEKKQRLTILSYKNGISKNYKFIQKNFW